MVLVRAKLIINSQFETTKKMEKMESKPKLDMEKLKEPKQTYKSKIIDQYIKYLVYSRIFTF